MRRGFATAGCVLGLLAGCPRLPAYTCVDDPSCDRDGMPGRCLDDGACVYADDACESGWRRSPNAAERPGQCEPAIVEGTSTIGDSSSDPVTTSSVGDDSSTGVTPTCGSQVAFTIDTGFFGALEVLPDYPVVVEIDDADLVAAIVAAGDEPWVTDDDGVLVPHEVERLDADTLTIWVRLPAYELDAAIPLRLRFGAAPPDHDATEAWSSRYAGVWHMGDELSGIDGDAVRNSVVPTEAGRTVGDMAPEQTTAGVVGRGIVFDGVDDTITVDAAFVGTLESYSLSMWLRFDGPDDAPGDYFQRLNGDYFYPRCWRQAGAAVFCQYIVDDMVTSLGSGLSQQVDQLRHLAMVRDAEAGTHRLYIDGELVNENVDPIGATLPDDGYVFEIGHGELSSFSGLVDEVRVSRQPLSASWVRADFRTQLEPALVIAELGGITPADCEP